MDFVHPQYRLLVLPGFLGWILSIRHSERSESPDNCENLLSPPILVDVGRGAKKKCLADKWGFQPLNHNKPKCKKFPNNNHAADHAIGP